MKHTPPLPSRRQMLAALGAVGMAASLSACGRRYDSTAEVWWRQTLQMRDGSTLATSSLHGHPLLVNFWASWCAPCIREMPLLDAFYQQHRAAGWQVLGVAIDRKEAVEQFLQRQPVQFPIAIAGMEGMNLMRELGDTKGALPLSLVFDTPGDLSERHSGQVDTALLENWISNTITEKRS